MRSFSIWVKSVLKAVLTEPTQARMSKNTCIVCLTILICVRDDFPDLLDRVELVLVVGTVVDHLPGRVRVLLQLDGEAVRVGEMPVEHVHLEQKLPYH